MLKGIPSIIPPELLKILMEMGHGDDIVIGDGNFPAASMGKRLVRCDGHNVPDILDAILQLYPLDTFVDEPVSLMSVVPGTMSSEPEIWATFRKIIDKHDSAKIEFLDRFDFYERAKSAYAIVATGESAIYANLILKKGIIT